MSIIFHPNKESIENAMTLRQGKLQERLNNEFDKEEKDKIKGEQAGLSAEKIVFSVLSNSEYLNEKEYHIFWDYEFDNLSGEADFILIGPDGLFVIEVKSGKWEWNQESNKWTNIKNPDRPSPHKQAIDNKDKIIKYIRKKNSNINFLHDFFIALPHTNAHVVSAGIDRKETLLQENLDNFDAFFNEFLKRSKQRYPYSKGIKNINRIVGYFTTYVKDNGHSFLSVEQQEEFATTEEQRNVIKFFNSNKRILLEGPAGSGKTLILLSILQNSDNKDKKKLYLCFNSSLKDHIKKNIPSDLNCDVYNIDGLIKKMVKDKNTQSKYIYNDDESKKRCIEELYTNNLINDEDKYDMILIDEGQDIFKNYNYFLFVDELLKEGMEEGEWVFAYDIKQSLFLFNDEQKKTFESILKDFDKYGCKKKLDKIIRTPNEIILDLKEEIEDNMEIPESIIIGGACVLNINNMEYIVNDINKKIKEIKRKKGDNTKFVILTTHNYMIEQTKKYLNENIDVTTIGKYKGLEADIVFLIKKNKIDAKSAYVAYTRAKYALYIYKIEQDGAKRVVTKHNSNNVNNVLSVDDLIKELRNVVENKNQDETINQEFVFSFNGKQWEITGDSIVRSINYFIELYEKDELLESLKDRYSRFGLKVLEIKGKDNKKIDGFNCRLI